MAMKNRKTIIVAFMLLACMLIGVGYAALNDTLNITANIGATTEVSGEEFDGNIKFTDKTITTDSTNKASCVISGAGDEATITADGFTAAGQTVVAVLTITNSSTAFDAKVTPTVTLDTAHVGVFSASAVWVGGDDDMNGDEMTIAGNGGTAQVQVTITLLTTPDEAHTATFTVDFGVVSTEITAP